ncbi:hypothetical protein MMC25_003203 [Agyrium rufum]|nr:hypothetical protein [Agyrium rufum]
MSLSSITKNTTAAHQATNTTFINRNESLEDTLHSNAESSQRKKLWRFWNGSSSAETAAMEVEIEEEPRPQYIHSMIAGGLGGTTGDLLMHSLDTVKTRQQGDLAVPSRYTTMASTYATIFRQEGIRRGLYSGVTPAFLGSFPGTVIFFGTYEYSKRQMIDSGTPNSIAYLAAGFIADFAASFVYVPSEVLKTRLQLQGRYNNPYFSSSYNYRSTYDAFNTIVRTEGFAALFHGYKATIFRDLPFSAIQFAFYEQEQKLAKKWMESRDIGLGLEILTGAAAGGVAGVLTCPLDVVKTRIQTQVNPIPGAAPIAQPLRKAAAGARSSGSLAPSSPPPRPAMEHVAASSSQRRTIATSSPSTSVCKPGAINLDTSSIMKGLMIIRKTEGMAGWFRGVGPRAVWTSTQSSVMLVLYQTLLKKLEAWNPQPDGDPVA